MKYTKCIKDIKADKGFVVISIEANRLVDITITIGEALDRAATIKELTTEKAVDNTDDSLYDAFMDAAAEARVQQKELFGNDFVDHDLEEASLRQLELYSQKRVKIVYPKKGRSKIRPSFF